EGEQENIAEQRVVSASLPEVQHLEKNSVCRMCPVTVASASTQMCSQRKRVRKSGQQETRSSDFRELFLRAKLTQLLFQVEFEAAKETVPGGTSSHTRPPDCEQQGWRAGAFSAGCSASYVFCRQRGRGRQ